MADNGTTAARATPASPALHLSPLTRSLLAGALAGTSVDVLLYPLDTLKTRLQSARGLVASGGLRGVYAGLGSVVVGSAPGGALFFVVYERVKAACAAPPADPAARAAAQMLAASLGEVAACAVRVPTEVVKQRAQARQHASSLAALRAIVARAPGPGAVAAELYTGWGATVLREVPFTVLQFPLWEGMKAWAVRRRRRKRERLDARTREGAGAREGEATALESAIAGSLSGAFSAAATTPLDVIKTRMMLAKPGEPAGMAAIARDVWHNGGARAFFRGVVPRTAWIGAGGAVFLGSYQWCWNTLGG